MGSISLKAIEEHFFKFASQFNLLKTGSRTGIGVSGGPDSVCLALLMKRYQKQLHMDPVVIHINHHLRGEESDRDEQFVMGLSKNILGFEFVKYDINLTRKELKGNSLEALARDRRYAVFEQGKHALKLDCIAIAHTMNDNAETILINMLRGTGITGISGIPPARDYIVRPMLGLSRKDVMTYLKLNSASYMHDTTNDSPDHLRNRVRHAIIPELLKLNPGFLEHMLSLAGDLRETDGFLDGLAMQAYNNAVAGTKEGILSLDIKKLLSYDSLIIKRILQTAIRTMLDTHYNPRREYIDHTMDILMDRQDNSRILDMFPGKLRVYKDKRFLIFDKTGTKPVIPIDYFE